MKLLLASTAAAAVAYWVWRRRQSKSSKHPTPLELISSPDPQRWTKMVDLTCRLPASVQAFNKAHPEAPITLLGKAEYTNPGMSHKDRIAKCMLERAEARGDLVGPDGRKKQISGSAEGLVRQPPRARRCSSRRGGTG